MTRTDTSNGALTRSADRPASQPARVAPADRVLAVSLAVDAALDPKTAGAARSHRNPPCL
jgi:hypothetical protein